MKRRIKAGKRRNSGLGLNVLTDDECNEIHLATLDVLKHTGVYVEHEEALERFGDAGCMVDSANKVVKFPNWVVEDAIRSAPSSFYAYGRRPEDGYPRGQPRYLYQFW
jgi:trimethylamine--corrinoid protein Co-methyltransferase